MSPIVIVDYGMGNFGSIHNMLKHLGFQSLITNDPEKIDQASKIIISGVGAFDNGMKNLKNLNLEALLNKKALKEKVPILGICLGMQLFTKRSEEGISPGLGWFNAETIKFKFNHTETKLKVPHMGWNQAQQAKASKILKDLPNDARFYFVHSYHCVCQNPEDPLLTTIHGYAFTSAIENENIIGVQFHPEKSHKFGMKLLENFSKL